VKITIFIRLLITLTFSLPVVNPLFSQKETWIWVFGYNNVLNFNTIDTFPIPMSIDNMFFGTYLYSYTSTISDSAGNLLFFNGRASLEDSYNYISNWNKFYEPMDNSRHSEKMSGDDYLIINFPGRKNLYYSIKTCWHTLGANSVYTDIAYDIIDMKKDNGAGSVILKMPQDRYHFPERSDYDVNKALPIKHSNNIETWIVTIGNSAEYQCALFKSYLFSDNGIKDTVLTFLQKNTVNSALFNKSTNGKFVVSSFIYEQGYLEYHEILISSFNNKTGTFSRYKSFTACDSCLIISAAFSPDASKLYTIEIFFGSKEDSLTNNTITYSKGSRIFQYDLTKSSAEIPKSKKQIGSTITWGHLKEKIVIGKGGYYDIQLSPDNKLYISRFDTNFLSVIENPNDKWEKIKYIDKFINLGKGTVIGRFPVFCNNYYNTHLSITTDSSFCEGDTLIIEAGLSDNTYKSSYLWTGPKGEIYDTPKITIPNCNVSQSGIYRLVVDVNGAKLHDSAMIKIISNPVPLIKGSKEAYIKTIEEYSTNDNMDYFYFWEVEGGNILTNPNRSRISVRWDSVGNCFVKLNRTNIKTGCVSSSLLEVIVREFPEANISGDTTACQGDTILFNTFFNQNLTYNWELKDFRPISSLNESNIRIVCDTAGYGKIKLIRKNKITEEIDSVERLVLIHQRPEKPLIKLNPDTTLEVTAGGYRYKWFKDGKLISEQSENKIKLETTGRYSVILIDQNGCESELSEIIEIILSNKETSKHKSSITISPNPAREYIEIEFSSPRLKPWFEGVDAIKIFNLLGECVLSVAQTFPSVDSGQTGMSDLLRIDVSGLPAGVYFVRVGDWVGRFVKI